ncbi:uncharacterized protein LOC143597021 [Bidens hawaiensis]|uniref:uncharacterized protein LOC143597021 n=1 Tax=Bidens hawaiensis TaxID=980011 RepID=UPI00404A3482
MTPILQYLQDGIVPEDRQEARRLRIWALQYEIIDGSLYRRSYLGPSLKCIDYEEAEYVIREIHEGICGMHIRAKMVDARAMRAGYYWLAMFMSALREIRKCESCQIYAPITQKPKLNLIPRDTFQPHIWDGDDDTCRIGSPTRRMRLTEVENENDLRLNLNLDEERREMAAQREPEYKKKTEKY